MTKKEIGEMGKKKKAYCSNCEWVFLHYSGIEICQSPRNRNWFERGNSVIAKIKNKNNFCKDYLEKLSLKDKIALSKMIKNMRKRELI